MSDPLSQTNLSDAEPETPVTDTSVQTDTPVVEEPTPSVNETELVLEGLNKQFEDEFKLPETEEPVVKDDTSQGPPKADETTDEPLPEEYDPEELYKADRKEVSEVEVLKETVASLQTQLQQVLSAPREKVESAQGTQQRPYEILPLVNAEEFEVAMASPESMNRLLNRAMYTGVEMATRQASVIATQAASSILATQRAIDSYLTANPDLKPHEKLMSLAFRDIASKDPAKPFEKMLVDAGEEARRLLKRRAQKPGQLKTPEGKEKQRPAFARPSGGGNRGGKGPVSESGRSWEW